MLNWWTQSLAHHGILHHQLDSSQLSYYHQHQHQQSNKSRQGKRHTKKRVQAINQQQQQSMLPTQRKQKQKQRKQEQRQQRNKESKNNSKAQLQHQRQHTLQQWGWEHHKCQQVHQPDQWTTKYMKEVQARAESKVQHRKHQWDQKRQRKETVQDQDWESMHQCSYSCIEEWQEDYNSNKWRPTGGTSRTEATRASHLQQRRIRYREVEARNAKRYGIHENTIRGGRCYKAYTSTKTSTWSRQHHRVKMGLQIQKRWSTSKDRSKRVHRTHRRPRWCVRKYTTLCSAKDTPSTQHGQRMDCTGRWHIYRLLTRTGSKSRLGTQTTKGVLHQSKHPLEATLSNVRPTKQPESMAGALSKSAYRPRPKKTTIRAQCLHQWQSLHHGLRWRPSLYRRTWWGRSNFQTDTGQDVASPYRHLHNEQHNWLPWQEDYKQRRLLWSLFGKQLHRQHPPRSKPTKCNSSRHYRFPQHYTYNRTGGTPWHRRARPLQAYGRKAAMAFIHATRHELCSKRTIAFFTDSGYDIASGTWQVQSTTSSWYNQRCFYSPTTRNSSTWQSTQMQTGQDARLHAKVHLASWSNSLGLQSTLVHVHNP